MANEKILIIDDSAEIRDFLSRQVLPRAGYVCIAAGDGRAGLEMLGRERPDLVLSDMQMPRMSGLEILQQLAQYKVDIPVVLMTAHGSETIAVEAFRLGVKDYLTKPFGVDEVLRVVDKALGETRLRRERDSLTRNLSLVNQQLQQRVQEMTVLSRVRQAVSALLDPSTLMKRIIEAAAFVSNANRGALSLVDEASGDMRINASLGFPQPLEGIAIPPKSIMGSALQAHTPLLLAGKQLSAEPYGRDAPTPAAFMAAPIKAQDRLLGVLAVDRNKTSQPFDESDARLLSALAEYAAIAMQNARMFGEIQSGQQKLSAVIESTGDGIILLNARHEVSLVNPAANTLLGATVALNQLLPSAAGVTMLIQLLNRAQATHKAQTQELTGARGKTLSASVSPVPEIGYVVMLHDITMLKELERIRREREQGESEKLRQTFERYVSPTIVQHILKHGEDAIAQPEVRQVIALAAGLHGFGSLVDRLQPESLVQDVLNRHFTVINDILIRYGGTIDKFTGDSVLAIFGWPETTMDDAERALSSAVEMQQAFAQLSAEWQTSLSVQLELGIGLGQGQVVAGHIGSPQHQDYTVIGDAVSIALTLSKQARGSDVLMSRSIFDMVNAVPAGVSFEETPPIQLKGKSEPHDVVLVKIEASSSQ